MVEQFANNADSTLNGAINDSTTSIVVVNGSSFPSVGNFRLLIGSDPDTGELVLVTARSVNTLTVVRGQESTSAQSWPDGTTVTHIVTAGAIITLRDTLKGKTLNSLLETISISQDGYALTWLNTDGYWAARPGSPFTISGNELNTTRTLSIDGYGTFTSSHFNPQLYVNGNVLSSSSFSVGDIPLSTSTYNYVSDGYQTFVVPTGVTQLQVKMWGPGAGTGNYNNGYGGASGGYSTGFLTVTPGETLVLAVGSGGKKSVSSTGNGGAGGWPSGGNGSRGDASAGGGGGLSGVFTTSYSQANALMIAGGGGGSSGYTGGGTPGAGGGSSGADGSDLTSGKGGTQIFGGFGGGPAVYTVTQTTGGTYETGITDVGNHTDDSPLTAVALPFSFVFYGVSYSSLNVSSNGFINFNSSDTSYAWDIPGTARPATINLWNRDNTTSGGDRGWYTKTIGTTPNRIFVLEYRGYQLGTGNTINAEVKLYEGTTTFEVLYSTSTSIDTSGTIGIQDNLGAHYTIYNNNTAPPANGTRLVYTADANITGKPLAGGSAFTDVTTSQANDAGGGGSGYFGGGAGQGDGRQGGGGSGYLHPTRVTNGTTTAGTNGAIGVVGAAPPSVTDTNYVAGIGVGGAATGTGSDGGNGRIAISYGNSSNLATNSLVLGNNASLTAPVGYSDLYLNTSSGGNIVLNPSSGLVTLQGTSALSSTSDLILSFASSLKVSSSSVNKFKVYSTGAVNIGEGTNNDTSSEAQAGLTGPLINLSPATGTFTSTTNQALNFNIAGAHHIQGNTEVRFDIAANLAGYFDSNRTFRIGPNAATSASAFGGTTNTPFAGDFMYGHSTSGDLVGRFAASASGNIAAMDFLNTTGGATTTVMMRIGAAGPTSGVTAWQNNGIIEQGGIATSAIVFTKTSANGSVRTTSGRIYQSGAWSIGDATQNDTSSEAQAGLTGPLLNITQTTGGTLTTVANQSLIYNAAGIAIHQGHSGVNLIVGTTTALAATTTTITAPSYTIGTSGPSITTGTGVPATTVPNGSLFLRSDGASSTAIYTRQSGAWATVGALPDVNTSIAGGILTVSNTELIPTTNVVAASTLYYKPYLSGQIAIYDGSAWNLRTFTFTSLALTGLTADKNYDVFINWNGSAIVITLGAAWTSDTLRAEALDIRDGVVVKTGNHTKRWVGTIRASSATTTEDTLLKRFVWNAYNGAIRKFKVTESTANWTDNTSGWRAARNQATNAVEYVTGDASSFLNMQTFSLCSSSGPNAAASGVGIDSTTVNSADVFGGVAVTSGLLPVTSAYAGYPGLGYHKITWLERSDGSTVTYYGIHSDASGFQSGMTGEIFSSLVSSGGSAPIASNASVDSNAGFFTIVDNVAGNGSYPSTNATNWTGTYSADGYSRVLIIGSATGGQYSSGGPITLNLKIDNVTVRSVTRYANTNGIHATFPTLVHSVILSAGDHTIALTQTGSNTFTNSDSYANLYVYKTPSITNISWGATKTSNYTATPADTYIPVDTASNAVTITLPASPDNGERHLIADVGGLASISNIIVDGNGHNIIGVSTYIMTGAYNVLEVAYHSGKAIWVII